MSINKKEAELQAKKIVKRILDNKNNLFELLKAVKAKEDSIRYPNAIALERLYETNPEIIYPEWDFFVEMIKSKNWYHKIIAIFSIANLALIDTKNKFEEVFDNENFVRVPIEKTDENDEPVREFKTYKILKRLEGY